MALSQMIVWKDRANAVYIQLVNNSVILTEEQMGLLTKVSFKHNGTYYDSTTYPDVFDWSTLASTGKLIMRPGLLPLASINEVAELIIYDATNTAGILWDQIAVQVREDAAV